MCSSRRPRLTAFVLLLLPALLLAKPPVACAAEPLAWKFEPGLENRYRITTDMVMSIDLGAGGTEAQNITNIIDLSWTVAEVQDDGAAVLKQKVDRMRMSIAPPTGEKMEFDTQSTDEPQGFAAMIAPLLRAMTSSEFSVTMTPRGKITNVDVPQPLIDALAASPGAAMLGEMATAEGFKNLVGRSAFELPETLEPGATWETTAEVANPVLGVQTIRTTYEYAGPKEVEGRTYEAITPKLEITFAGGPAEANVTRQESTGQILFDREAGRLESMTLDHEMDLELTADDNKITQKIKQATNMQRVEKDAAE